MTNDRSLVRRVCADLEEAGFVALVIGGWAEELHGVAEPRAHGDVDVVLLDPPLAALDSFVAERREVVEKHLSQKRAYLVDDVLVELFVAQWNGGRYETLWWGLLPWCWSGDMKPVTIAGLPVAPQAALTGFRDSYSAIIAARPW